MSDRPELTTADIHARTNPSPFPLRWLPVAGTSLATMICTWSEDWCAASIAGTPLRPGLCILTFRP